MSTTPRTDAECIQIYNEDVTGCSDARDYVDASFARELETELAAAKAECERLKSARWKYADDPEQVFTDDYGWLHVNVKADIDELIARAEKAEDELKQTQSSALNWARFAAEKADGEDVAKQRAERAEAALAEAKVERETVAEASLRSLESYIDKLKQFAERAEKAEAECLEQARLLGKSGEREADLLGKLERLAKDKARLDWLAVSDVWFDFPATEAFTPETFRAAIDAAMKP